MHSNVIYNVVVVDDDDDDDEDDDDDDDDDDDMMIIIKKIFLDRWRETKMTNPTSIYLNINLNGATKRRSRKLTRLLYSRERSSCTSKYWDPAFPHVKCHENAQGPTTTFYLGAKSWRTVPSPLMFHSNHWLYLCFCRSRIPLISELCSDAICCRSQVYIHITHLQQLQVGADTF